MGKIVYLMGKSSSGKDTVFKKLMKKDLGLQPIVPYTTRPIRAGEENGVQYFFTDVQFRGAYPVYMRRYFAENQLHIK